MAADNLILDKDRTVSLEDIEQHLNVTARSLWQELMSFVKSEFKTAPILAYSTCSAQPGWNVKFRKSGKAICTLYPQKNDFIVLVVVPLGLLPVLQEMKLEQETREVINTARPFNGTLWLMLNVDRHDLLEDIRKLLIVKHTHK